MPILLDTANVRDIARAMEIFPVAGVTTNPTLAAREKRDFFELITEIASLTNGKMLHVQVIGTDAVSMIHDAESIAEFVPDGLHIKIPVSPEGYKAMRELKKRGFHITATAVFTPGQALLAAECGADFTAPYWNRLEDIGVSAENTVREIAQLYKMHGYSTRILAASFKNVLQITSALLAGTHDVTIAPELLWKFAGHPLTDSAIQKFTADWESFYDRGLLKKQTEN